MNLEKLPTTDLVRELLRRFDRNVFDECEKSFCDLAREIENFTDGDDDVY